MSITLVCLVKGNLPANAFPVDIDRNKLVGYLKEAIKAKKTPEFDSFPADRLKLWKVEIPDDHDSELADPTLNEELLATKKISKYFPATPAEECIHVIVELPVPIASSSREQELLDRIASLEASINKSVHEFDVVVSPKRTKGFKWTVNIEHATLEALKNSIRAVYQTPALENDGAVFNMVCDGGKYSPQMTKNFAKCSTSLSQKTVSSLPYL